ncbi:hypothetical protein QEP66_23545 [Streptomyces sp. LB8]|uniref:hypothetical protein n=1 Tax=Streptomyces sp. LB8 TaxID=3042509 RepID=UPI0026474872|nr:hypothetical protein [Streptomyces sp. LB8]MDN5385015.1 hypothetical protein [Streptomyces sp. LB8]
MNTTTPLYAKAAAIVGRPLVLLAALFMSAPAEISLSRTAGFSGGTEYLAPFVLSLYAACAATVAATRPKGVRGRLSAILGAGLALGFALSAQVTAHLLSAGHITSGPWLITAVSSVPSIAAAHLLHLAVVPRAEKESTEVPVKATDEPEKAEEESKAPTPQTSPESRSKGRSRRPSLQVIRDAADTLDKTGQKVTAKALAQWFGVSERTGARYLSALKAA